MMTKVSREIIFFGSYPDDILYSRNQELRRAFQNLNYRVIELKSSYTNQAKDSKSLVKRTLLLCLNSLSLFRHLRQLRQNKLVFVPYPAYIDMLILRLCTLGKKPTIIVDAFLGLYDTIVNDRKILKQGSIWAWLVAQFERYVLSLSDMILIDTREQAEMLSDMYAIPSAKLFEIPVGINEALWAARPMPKDSDEFIVMFWGTFIPLHGIETIVRAAQHIDCMNDNRIKFKLYGTGQTANEVKQQLQDNWPTNLEWQQAIVKQEQLANLAAKAHCVLGIFGESDKAANVVPYKIYQALAIDRPVITRVSRTLGPELKDYGIFTVTPGSYQALANQISQLANDRNTLSRCTPRDYYDSHLSNEVIQSKIMQLMKQINHV